MRLHFRAHSVWLIAAATSVLGCSAFVFSAVDIRIGQRLDYSVPIVLLIPLLTSLVIGLSLESSASLLAHAAVVPMRFIVLISVLVVAGIPVVTLTTTGLIADCQTLPQVVRNQVFFIGLVLLVDSFIGRWYWLPTIGYLLTAITNGVTSTGTVSLWAIVVDRGPVSIGQVIATLLMGGLGVAAQVVMGRKITTTN